MTELEKLQKEKIEVLKIAQIRAIAMLTYQIENKRYTSKDKAKEIRNILKGVS